MSVLSLTSCTFAVSASNSATFESTARVKIVASGTHTSSATATYYPMVEG